MGIPVSLLETYDIQTGERALLKEFAGHIEAPNWSPDGKRLLYNSAGRLFWFDLATKRSERIETGVCASCNNDHVISRDGSMLAISSGCETAPKSRVWVLASAGGKPTLVTEKGPSYLHGWSPDGSTLAYCAERGGEFDVYTIRLEDGAQETRLTNAPGLNDGPEYSPDGRIIWFNSVRTGLMQVWRMLADGSGQTQVTFDAEWNSWFPHISPDGRKVVYLRYRKDDVAPGDHPPGKQVEICMVDSEGGKPVTLMRLFGGQGTMNVNSWDPESRRFAFVNYRDRC